MIISKKITTLLILLLSFTIVILLSTLFIHASAKTDQSESSPAISYEVNENGQTFGDFNQAEELGYFADLMLAEGEDGVVGYVYYNEFIGDQPKNPEEALKWQEENIGKDQIIPLYESDGITVIGQFILHGYNPEEAYIEYFYE